MKKRSIVHIIFIKKSSIILVLNDIFYNISLIISVKLTLSSISSALLDLSVSHISTKGNSVLTVFIIVKTCGEIFNSCTNCLFGTKLNNTFDAC